MHGNNLFFWINFDPWNFKTESKIGIVIREKKNQDYWCSICYIDDTQTLIHE